MSAAAEAVDAAYEEFGVQARLTRRGGLVATVLVRRATGPAGEPLLPGWSASPGRQAAPFHVGLRRSEAAADPSRAVLEILSGPDAGLYDIGDCTARPDGLVWLLPLNPQAKR